MLTALPPTSHRASRLLAPAALAVAGALFVLYPAARPYGDLAPDTAASAFSSPAWLVAHLAAVAGFVLLPLGLFALDGRASALIAVGSGLTLPYYGAETFGLHAIGNRVAAGGDPALLDLVDDIRTGPVQITTFALGLTLIAAGAVWLAIAVWRSPAGDRWTAVPLAAGFVLFIPQFYATAPWRIADGVLIGAGCVLLAAEVRRRHSGRRRSAPQPPRSRRRGQWRRAASFVLEHQRPAGGPLGTPSSRAFRLHDDGCTLDRVT